MDGIVPSTKLACYNTILMEKLRLTIAVDNDDVLANLNVPLYQFHNHHYGTNLRYKDTVSYNLWQVWQCSKEEAIKRVHNFFESEYFYKMKPIRGAVEGIETLSQRYNLIVVTSRPYLYMDLTTDWLNRYFPNKFLKVYHTNHFSPDGSLSKSKASLCSELEISTIVEDGPQHVTECSQAGIRVLLFNRRWNQTTEFPNKRLPEGVERVYSWKQIIKKLIN